MDVDVKSIRVREQLLDQRRIDVGVHRGEEVPMGIRHGKGQHDGSRHPKRGLVNVGGRDGRDQIMHLPADGDGAVGLINIDLGLPQTGTEVRRGLLTAGHAREQLRHGIAVNRSLGQSHAR